MATSQFNSIYLSLVLPPPPKPRYYLCSITSPTRCATFFRAKILRTQATILKNAMHRHNVSPPIHHPVPQRPVQVPVMQSPPPPPQSSDPYDSPYGAPSYPTQASQHAQHQSAGYNQFGGFGQGASFFADPTAQMGFNVARAAMSGGTDLAEKNVLHPPSSK